MNAEEKKYTAPALEKGLDIIELLSAQELGLSLSDIARALSRSVGEIFRMLAVLEQRGYVAQDSVSGRYVLTTFLFEIAHKLPVVRRLSLIAGPRMRRLAGEVRQSVHLGIITNNEVLVVAQVDSPSYNVMSVRLGAKINLWKTSSGRVIAAYLDPAEIERLRQEIPFPPEVDPDEFIQGLMQIRKVGFEVRDSFVVRGVVNISAPVLDHSGQAAAALTIPHIERMGDAVSFVHCKKQLVGAARELSKALGAEAPTSSDT
jgi:DNA-binding IclR family transcriptional regulator